MTSAARTDRGQLQDGGRAACNTAVCIPVYVQPPDDDPCDLPVTQDGPGVTHDSRGDPAVADDWRNGSSGLSMEQVREGLRQYCQAIGCVDTGLMTLKTQLIHMREQDLRLLRQLIHIGDTIRRLSRWQERHSRERCGRRDRWRRGTQGAEDLMTSAADLSVTLRRLKGRSGSVLGSTPGDYSTVPLLRRQSEPHVCTLSPRDGVSGDVRSWGSGRGSGSSSEWWSEDTLGSSDDGLDAFESENDLHSRPNTTTTTSTAAFTSTTTTTTTLSLNLPSPTTDNNGNNNDDGEEPAPTKGLLTVAAAPDSFQRPKSHSVVAATFLNRPELSGGNSAYSDILNQNVRLWKHRLGRAQSVRQKVSILEEES